MRLSPFVGAIWRLVGAGVAFALLTACGGAAATCTEVLCPGGGVLAAEVSESTLPTCGDVQQRYDDVVEAGRVCTCDSDCRVLIGQCAAGLGGCYEPAGPCAEQGLLDELAALHGAHSAGCATAECQCGELPAARCVEGRCELTDP